MVKNVQTYVGEFGSFFMQIFISIGTIFLQKNHCGSQKVTNYKRLALQITQLYMALISSHSELFL